MKTLLAEKKLDRSFIKAWHPHYNQDHLVMMLQATKNIFGNFEKVHTDEILGLSVLSCTYCEPHTDLDFPKWSALWILRHSNHVIYSGSIKYKLTVGDIVLLNVHHQHYLHLNNNKIFHGKIRYKMAALEKEKYCKENTAILMPMDFVLEPTKAEVEALLQQRLVEAAEYQKLTDINLVTEKPNALF